MNLEAIIFVPALAGSVIFGFVFLLFTSNYYLSILESTGAGAREVSWFNEPILDSWWKLWYFLWLFGLWFGPAYLLGRTVTAGSESVWLKLAVPVAFVWLLYPVSQLSSLSASTIWLPLVPDVFARLAQKPAVTLGFYALSIPVLALFTLAFKWAFLTKGEWQLLFVGAPLMMLAAFLYARLIGRLAFVLRFTKPLFRDKKKKKPKPEANADAESPADEEVVPTIRQTRDLPPINTIEGEVTGYDLKLDDETPRKRLKAEVIESDDEAEPTKSGEKAPPAKRTGRPTPPPLPPTPPPLPKSDRRAARNTSLEPGRTWTDEDEEEPTSYGVHAPEVVPEENTPKEVVKPREDEMRLLSRHDAPKKPKQAWNLELLAFLPQPGTISALIIASGMCFAVGVMVRIARDFNPVADTNSTRSIDAFPTAIYKNVALGAVSSAGRASD